MTTDESIGERVVRLDERLSAFMREMRENHTTNTKRFDAQDKKLEALMSAANMGRGAWGAVLRIGGLIVVALAGLGWAFDHIVALFRSGHP